MTLTSRLHAGHVMYLNQDLASFNVDDIEDIS